MILYSLTDIGAVREHNEDCVCQDEQLSLLAVADGMGGHKAGEYASRLALRLLLKELEISPQIITQNYLIAVTKKINAGLFRASLEHTNYDGMGSTLVFAILRAGRVFITNLGDSRAYLLRGDTLRQITIDHSHVQRLRDRGEITAEEMRRHPLRNLLTKSLGLPRFESPDIFDLSVSEGDLYLLCSDGLTGMLKDAEIKDILAAADSLKSAAKELIQKANSKGGKDNITAALMKIEKKDVEN